MNATHVQAHFFDAPVEQQLGWVGGSQTRWRQIWRNIRQGGAPERGLTQSLQPLIRSMTRPLWQIKKTHRSVCGTTRFELASVQHGDTIEMVLIPNNGRTTLCISSQVGCARGCIFCMTGTMGLMRQLSAAEIQSQVGIALQWLRTDSGSTRDSTEERNQNWPALRNIVFMGMGEPLDNLQSVQASAEALVDPHRFGFGPRFVTISTVGPSVAKIHAAQSMPGRLAWSLHAAQEQTRRHLVPTDRASVSALRDAFAVVMEARQEPLFVEVTLIDGVNDREQDAGQVAELLAPIASLTEVRINLIAMNPGMPGLRGASEVSVQRFKDLLFAKGYRTLVRTARGENEAAACGQLVKIGLRPKKHADISGNLKSSRMV